MLMKSFYAHFHDGMAKAEALRQAQEDVRKEYPSPYYWAGFILTGDPGIDKNAAISDSDEYVRRVNVSIIFILAVGIAVAIGVFLLWSKGKRVTG